MTVHPLGRPSIIRSRPEIVQTVRDFIDQSSTGAHLRRRTDTKYIFGCTAKQILQHVRTKHPDVVISESTIRRMMVQPHRGRRAAAYYKGEVNARRPATRNDFIDGEHKDFQFTCSQVNYLSELAFLFKDECTLISADDKNKVNVGTLAVSRHIKTHGYFPESKTPNNPDHDFPFPNSKLTPSGYMILNKQCTRSRSCSPLRKPRVISRRCCSLSPPAIHKESLCFDKSGRPHIPWPRSGPLHVYIHADRYMNSTSQMHYHHLNDLIKNQIVQKPVLGIICDGGPDWSSKCPANVINYGRLWRDNNLDLLILSSYAPKHSRYNPIEHAWSPLTKWLAGVTIPITLEGESIPPFNQNIPQEEKEQKTKKVFQNAINTCAKFWRGRTFNNFPIHVKEIDIDSFYTVHKDHDILKQFTNCSKKKAVEDFGGLLSEYTFFIKHLVRKHYQYQFLKCTDTECMHCRNLPIKAKKTVEYIQRCGGTLPSPIRDDLYQGHYKTFLQMFNSNEKIDLDQNIPSLGKTPSQCTSGCMYVFLSEADRKRHNRLIHKT